MRRYNHRKMVVLALHPAFAVWSAVFIGADMTSPVALYLPLWFTMTASDCRKKRPQSRHAEQRSKSMMMGRGLNCAGVGRAIEFIIN